ncbi:universal stress protein [Paractinoplanes abujensis]|uniref:Nucleotide-binding universal stress UspA family protein n=1 Tax=Paractinoplanes abujensis TaxID=882441 RepID=A0A7W7CL21_9ACTN|nr:universal stress protein [Actinoplanes abujensis]MBB4690511.1 nucleotide-binding universal stress UspA family protein [Actinoplanes abujensis]GID21278.1 universal stress protein [Actinoplanes abujensis]
MTGPVIAGVDGGTAAADALALGHWFAETLGAPLVVAVVHPAPAALGSGRVDAEWVADRHRAAQRVLDDARATLTGVRGEVAFRMVASSSAAHGLHDLAEQTQAAMVVIGSGRHATRERLMAGSTAERLLAGSVCPIAIAPAAMPAPPTEQRRIGVAYVDTPDGRTALTAAAEMARRTGDTLKLYTVVAEGDASLPFLIGDDVERAFLETARETYEQSLRKAADSLPGVTAEWQVVAGDVVDTLADLTDVDVLYCGSRGYGPARRVLLGGVSTRLIRRACRPLVVVPRSG